MRARACVTVGPISRQYASRPTHPPRSPYTGVYASLDAGEPPPHWGVHVERGRGMTELSQFQRSGAGAQSAIDVTAPVPHTEPEPRRRQSSVQGGEQRRGNVIFGTAADTGGGMPPDVEVRHLRTAYLLSPPTCHPPIRAGALQVRHFGTTYHSVVQRRGSGVKEAMDASLPLPEPQSLVARAAALAAAREGSSSGPPAAGRTYMAVRPGAGSSLDEGGGGARGGAVSALAGASNMDSLAEFTALRALGLPTAASGTARSGSSHSSHPADISATVAAAIARCVAALASVADSLPSFDRLPRSAPACSVPTQLGGEREPDYGAPHPHAAAGTGGYGVGLNYGGPGGGNTNPRFLGPKPPEHVIHGRRGSGVYSSLDMVRWTMRGEVNLTTGCACVPAPPPPAPAVRGAPASGAAGHGPRAPRADRPLGSLPQRCGRCSAARPSARCAAALRA